MGRVSRPQVQVVRITLPRVVSVETLAVRLDGLKDNCGLAEPVMLYAGLKDCQRSRGARGPPRPRRFLERSRNKSRDWRVCTHRTTPQWRHPTSPHKYPAQNWTGCERADLTVVSTDIPERTNHIADGTEELEREADRLSKEVNKVEAIRSVSRRVPERSPF